MPKILRTIIGAGLLLAVSLPTSPAHGETATTTVDVKAGKEAQTVGTATFTRTADEGGSETLTVDLSVAGGIEESHVCISDEPYSSRMAAGSCPYAQGSTGTTARFVIPLGTSRVGDPIYTQTSVVTGDETAFAGWVDGEPFFGNVRIEAVIAGSTVPAGNLIGLVGLSVLLGLVLVFRLTRRQSAARAVA